MAAASDLSSGSTSVCATDIVIGVQAPTKIAIAILKQKRGRHEAQERRLRVVLEEHDRRWNAKEAGQCGGPSPSIGCPAWPDDPRFQAPPNMPTADGMMRIEKCQMPAVAGSIS